MSLLKDFVHKQIPLEHVLSATNYFSDENLIREGGFGKIYKGTLLYSGDSIDIVARRLDPKYGQGDKEFFTEISMLSTLQHKNLVSFIGFCDEDEEKIVVNKYEANLSLDKYLSDPRLTWTQRLQICVGVAQALSYIFYEEGRNFSILHRNIKSSKILLDDDWKPKLSGFELSVKNPASLRHRGRLLLTDELGGTYGYVDPAREKTGSVSHKSDLFSLGVVVFEVLCGRRAFIPDEDQWSLMFTCKKRFEHLNIPKDGLLSELARSRYEEGRLDDMINPDLRKQMESQSYRIFSETAYYCLKEQPAQRPDIRQVVRRLQKALDLQYKYDHESLVNAQVKEYSSLSRNPPAIEQLPFLSKDPPTNQENGNIMSFSLDEYAHLRIPREDISLATGNFADENILVHGGDGKLYKGQLKRRRGQLIGIVARKLEGVYGQGEIELWTEVSMLSSRRDKNLVSIVGFCDEKGEKIIVYEHTGHGCLYQHLHNKTLKLSQRLQICLGVAQALKSIHRDIVHGDINVSNILIDNDWEAKVFGFGLSTKYPGNWGHRLLFSHYVDASTHRDPTYRNILSVTPKYDVYSFGLLLYDVLCGRKPMIRDYGEMEKLDDMIDGDLRKQMDTQSLTILSKIASDCLNRLCVQRPSIDQIVEELDSALKLQRKPENIEHSTLGDEAKPINKNIKEKTERLKISINKIRSTTNNFDLKYRLGSGGYGTVFEAELDHLDIQNIDPSDWKKNKKELPIKRSSVAIKRITKEGVDGFRAEIETLASCNHPNIVSLLGYSDEDREMILVFELASRGSLDDCLEKNKMANVTWAKRIQICLDVAHGLKYLHDNLEGKREIFHRDIKSANILLDEKWDAKIADFGLSKFNRAGNTLKSDSVGNYIVGTQAYVDPEYESTKKYAKASDVYSFGVVLFEILSGKLTFDSIYNVGNDKGIATVARRRYIEGTIKELIDPNMMEEDNEHIFTVNKGPNQKSLEAFTEVAHRCLFETKKERPELETIIKELEDALHFQGKTLVLEKFQLSDIEFATDNFAAKYCIGVSMYGMMYNAKLSHHDGKSLSQIERRDGGELPMTRNEVALKRIFNREDKHGKHGFFAEIDLLASFKHSSIVSLLGVSSENQEMVLIYKDSFKGSLHDCLRNTKKMAKLTWAKRIQISLDIAQGLEYLQTSAEDKQRITQFDMNSANILLDAKWRAKIACFWLSILNPAYEETNIVNTTDTAARKVQLDPEYIKIEKLKKESAVYSFGVILFEILCGKAQYHDIYYAKNEKGLPTIARRCYDQGAILKEMIDPVLKDKKVCKLGEEVNEDSFEAFLKIAYECCAVTEDGRPSMGDIIKELQSALNNQVEHLKHLESQAMDKLEHIPLNDILLATNDFSKENVIRSRRDITVYKGLDGGVAIKRIHRRQGGQEERGFMEEIKMLSEINHPNIVSSLGFCSENGEMILAFEYDYKKSLAYSLEYDEIYEVSWAQRLQICLDIAHGLCYLHTQQNIVHRNIQCDNILLNENMVAMIADVWAGTTSYLDPYCEFRDMELDDASDIYSFGVVLFEIMCGKVAYNKGYYFGLASIAKECFQNGTLEEIIDPTMRRDDEIIYMLNGGPINQDSLDTFSEIAYQCLAGLPWERPDIVHVVEELEKAYYFQTNNMHKFQILLEDIQLMTENFSDRKCIGEGRYWKQYEAQVLQANGYITLVAKRFDSKSDTQHYYFLQELKVLYEHKHDNIIGLRGYCRDMDERIIVYEQASKGRLSEHLDDAGVTWILRLRICIDVACGLRFLHEGGVTKDIPIIHGDVKSASILLESDWTARISNFELSLRSWGEYVTYNGSLGYVDPKYKRNGFLTQKSDIYSLGVVLLEMLCGRLAWIEGCESHSDSLGPLAKECFKEGKLEELVFEDIKKHIDPESLAAFVDIALRCLNDKGGERPEAGEVVIQLQKAVEFHISRGD